MTTCQWAVYIYQVLFDCNAYTNVKRKRYCAAYLHFKIWQFKILWRKADIFISTMWASSSNVNKQNSRCNHKTTVIKATDNLSSRSVPRHKLFYNFLKHIFSLGLNTAVNIQQIHYDLNVSTNTTVFLSFARLNSYYLLFPQLIRDDFLQPRVTPNGVLSTGTKTEAFHRPSSKRRKRQK